MAGIESTAKMRSVNSTVSNTTNNGVNTVTPMRRDPEVILVVVLGEFEEASTQLDDGVARSGPAASSDDNAMRIPREDQERTEDIEDPVEGVDECCADGDHGAAHEDRADDAP